MPFLTPSLFSRRRLVLTGAAATFAGAWPAAKLGAQSKGQVRTPRQTMGPFYPLDWEGDADGDLVHVRGAAAMAQGVITYLRGRVLDARGTAVPEAVVEIWQCDAFGRYRHPRDRQNGRDEGFQGRGRVVSGPDGSYGFRTIRAVAYPGRTPHIHAAIVAPGRQPLVTQLYVDGELLNERDGVFNGLQNLREQEAVLLRLEPADRIEKGAFLANRDIVLG